MSVMFIQKKHELILAHRAEFEIGMIYIHLTFYAPGSNDGGGGAYCFCPVCLFVCLLSTLTFAITFVRDKDFIFGMHTPLMTPLQLTPRSMTL